MLSCMNVRRHPRARVVGVDLVAAAETRIQMACGAIRGWALRIRNLFYIYYQG